LAIVAAGATKENARDCSAPARGTLCEQSSQLQRKPRAVNFSLCIEIYVTLLILCQVKMRYFINEMWQIVDL
jgi:hypothetical protein